MGTLARRKYKTKGRKHERISYRKEDCLPLPVVVLIIDYVPGIVLNALCTSSLLILRIALKDTISINHLPLTDQNTEVGRASVICLRSATELMAE